MSLAQADQPIRIATYNASLYSDRAGEVLERLSDAGDRQAEKIAAIVQVVRPDVLLINEIDFDSSAALAKSLAEKYFAVSQDGRKPVHYPHVRAFSSNTGIDSGMDLNDNDQLGEPEDAWGYGTYEGQYAFAIFSRFPINDKDTRTFQGFLWKDLPGALRPIDPETRAPFYDDTTWSKLRLSSKNHVDIPVHIGNGTLHVLASHPVPPVFDGPEDRNGCRNHDEIRFWSEYLRGEEAEFLVDDQGRIGGLRNDHAFVIVGDLNSDPNDGDSRSDAIRQLLSHARLCDPLPRSAGGSEEAILSNRTGTGNAALHTASFGGKRNLRIDYVLPSRNMSLRHGGVFWPKADDPHRPWISASDHRLVWVEVDPPAQSRQ